MSAHTPGPWDFCGLNKRWGIYPASAVNDGIDYFIATTRQISFPEREKANARLMAASPKLLEACKAAEEWLSGWASASPYIEVIRAAIQEAEGPIAGGEPVRSEAEPGHTPAQTNKGEG